MCWSRRFITPTKPEQPSAGGHIPSTHAPCYGFSKKTLFAFIALNLLCKISKTKTGQTQDLNVTFDTLKTH